ncbi:MAG: Coenzyme F420 hydrogenase/dehydrogenase, beta subunit C-terminal domain [Candidatus Bathyarchaeota archaeon]|nr:Coenzyme F420 hydrogenase/dehydrogenase, beta subunit C-terminal domain [Candidatus Bathyarchaeota archaeon]
MGQKSDSLIAYNVLEKRIIDAGFCTQCGACEAACPVSALHVEGEKVKHTYDCSKDMDLCPICYEICPHSEALLLRSLSFVADTPVKNEALGYYRKIVLAQAVDPKIRELSRGGGVVTSLLKFGIENKLFDSAIVSQVEPDNPAKPKASVATVPDDIMSAIGSKFFPSSVAKAYGSAVYAYGKSNIAFVGVPCHVLALRKLEAWQHKISNNLKITIGLFCFGTLSLNALLEYIKTKYNVDPSDVKQLRLSSKLVITTSKGELRIPMSEASEHILPSCRKCTDFTSELADISIGSAYPMKDWSTVIIRTKAGEDFFYKAVENGAINTWVIEEEPTVIERVMIAAMNKRNAGLKNAKEIEKISGYLPATLLRESEALAKTKIADIMAKNVKTVLETTTVSQFLDLVARCHHIGYPLVNQNGEPLGWITLEEAVSVDKEKRSHTTVGEIARHKLVTAYTDETALEAFKKMSENETGRIIILARNEPKKIAGVITKTDLMHILTQQ